MRRTYYAPALKEAVVRKVLQRDAGRTIADIAQECDVPYQSVRKWLGSAPMRSLRESLTGERRVNQSNKTSAPPFKVQAQGLSYLTHGDPGSGHDEPKNRPACQCSRPLACTVIVHDRTETPFTFA